MIKVKKVEKKVKVENLSRCPFCFGTGKKFDGLVCEECGGKGTE